LDGESTRMKVVDLEKWYNFIVDNFFIWIRLGPQIINLNSVVDWALPSSNPDGSCSLIELQQPKDIKQNTTPPNTGVVVA
jgi:hypothetical protein